jgi:hypothetical protein
MTSQISYRIYAKEEDDGSWTWIAEDLEGTPLTTGTAPSRGTLVGLMVDAMLEFSGCTEPESAVLLDYTDQAG